MNTFKAKIVRSDENYLIVELEDGRIISTPLEWYPELQKVSPEIISNYKLICDNTGIEWEILDYHLSVESMMRAIPAKEKVA